MSEYMFYIMPFTYGTMGSDVLEQRWETLSSREREVTAFTCLGYTNRQIAAQLRVSTDTVKGYVRKVLTWLLVQTKTEF